MYQYLDRDVRSLAPTDGFLLSAMRMWVHRARAGRCPCAALSPAFRNHGGDAALRDFLVAMAALDQDGVARLAFSGLGAPRVGDDEARVLGLFAAGLSGHFGTVRRIAARLVKDEAAPRLATAVEWVATHMSHGVFVERDR